MAMSWRWGRGRNRLSWHLLLLAGAVAACLCSLWAIADPRQGRSSGDVGCRSVVCGLEQSAAQTLALQSLYGDADAGHRHLQVAPADKNLDFAEFDRADGSELVPVRVASTADRDTGGVHLYDRFWWQRDRSYSGSGVDSGLGRRPVERPAVAAHQLLVQPADHPANHPVARPRQRFHLQAKRQARAPATRWIDCWWSECRDSLPLLRCIYGWFGREACEILSSRVARPAEAGRQGSVRHRG